MLNRTFEKCPYKSVIVRSCRLFIRSLMATNTVESNKKKLLKLLNHMINREIISPVKSDLVDLNMTQESIIAQRLFKDHMIANSLTPSTTEISKEMLASFKRSRIRYAEYLGEKRQGKLKNEQQIQK